MQIGPTIIRHLTPREQIFYAVTRQDAPPERMLRQVRDTEEKVNLWLKGIETHRAEVVSLVFGLTDGENKQARDIAALKQMPVVWVTGNFLEGMRELREIANLLN